MEKGTEGLLKEQNANLLSDILERNYYKKFVRKNSGKDIELIINRKNKISSCYGCFNNDEKLMYPDTDFSENDYEKIKSHLDSYLKFYIKNKWQANIELTGIDWTNDYEVSKSILDIIVNNFESSNTKPDKITISIDAEFIIPNNNLILSYTYYYNKLKEIGIKLIFNIYRNGLICDENWNENNYNTLFNFIESINNDCKIVAYITAKNVDKWIDNYNWWLSKLDKKCFELIELREQKTTDWTKDILSQYLIFLNYQVDIIKEIYKDNSLDIFFNRTEVNFNTVSIKDNQYSNNLNNNNNCNLFKNLTIDLTTMNIVPCAKTNYKDFANGTYNIVDGEIVGYIGKNVPMIIYTTHLKQICMPHCENCKHIDMCAGHCLGESYNKCYDLLVPIKEFCDLSIVKNNFLIYKYNDLNLINKELLTSLGLRKQFIDKILEFKKAICGGNE